MANDIKSNINININTNASEQVKQLNEVASAIKNIDKNAQDLNKNESIKRQSDAINEFMQKMDRLKNVTSEIKSLDSAFKDIDKNDSIKKQLDALDKFLQVKFSNTSQQTFDTLQKASSENEYNIPQIDSYNDALLKNIGVMQEFIDTGNLSRGTISKLAAQFGAAAPEIALVTLAITAVIKSFEIWNDLLDDTVDMIKNLTSIMGSGVISGLQNIANIGETSFDTICNGVDFAIDSINTIIDTLDTAINKIQEFSDKGIDIQNSYYNLYTLIGTHAADNIKKFTNSLASMYGLDSSSIVSGMTDIVAAAGSMGVSTSEMTQAIQNMTVYAQDLSILAGSFERAQLDIGNAISKGYVGKASVLYPLMTKNEIKQLKELSNETERYNYLMSISSRVKGRYNEYLNTEAGQVAILKSQYQGLLNNLSILALGLYAKIAPVLNGILKIVNAILETFIKIFNIDVKSYSDISGVTEGIANSMDKVTDSTEKANKSLASFDDVIQLSDTKDNTLSESVDPSSVDSWNDLFNAESKVKSKLDEIIEKVKKLFAEGKYYEAGKLLADELNNWLNSINWDSIIEKAGKAGKSIAQFLNGFIDTEDLWPTIGKTIGNTINTALRFLNEFAKEIHWNRLGKDIVTSWNAFWETFDEKLAGETLYRWFKGILRIALEFIRGDGIVNFVKSIVDTIGSALSNLSVVDVTLIADLFVGILDQLIQSVGIIDQKLKDIDLVSKLNNFIIYLTRSIKSNAQSWGETLGSALASIFNMAVSMLGSFLQAGGFKGIGDLLISTINSFFTNIDVDEAANNIAGLISNILSTISNVIDNTIGNEDTREKIKQLIQKLVELFSEHAEEWGTLANKIITDILGFLQDSLNTANNSGLQSAISTFLDNLDLGGIMGKWIDLKLSWFFSTTLTIITSRLWNLKNNIHNTLVNIGESIGNWLGNFFGGIFNSITSWFDKIISLFNKKSSLSSSIGGSLFNKVLPKSYSISNEQYIVSDIKIPKLARGGITKQSTLAMIGEAGNEAVLPLQNNTSWMDDLASKIASKLNKSEVTKEGDIIIDMSNVIKSTYTRSEMLEMGQHYAEALRVYGINVSFIG